MAERSVSAVSKDPRTVLLIARFQPFHKGHVEMIRWLIDHYERVVIAIGSAEKNYEKANPCTAAERYEMVRKSLIEEGMWAHVDVFQVPDTPSNVAWIQYLKSFIPSFQAIVGNNPFVARLARDFGIEPIFTPSFTRKELSGTNIRELMAHGDLHWRDLVPEGTREVIINHDIPARLRDLYGSD